ncbi:hypothetical protein B0O99DRAFT_610560 [Bisporella sp. PMI_857]|nr:hypothetical protein B0O99DRAFT_610560 [Bisporella sp. PMI_857]
MPSNLERLARRKRQTRLTFDPCQLRSASAIFITDQQKMQTKLKEVRGRIPFKPLPTPKQSSQQVPALDSEDENQIPRSSSRHSATKPAYVDLDSSDGSTPEDEISLPPPRLGRRVAPLFKTKKTPPKHVIELESSDEDLVISARRPNKKNSKVVEEDSDDEEPITSPLKRRRQAIEEDSDDSDLVVASPLKRRRAKRVGTDEDEDEDDLPPASSNRNTRRAFQKPRHRTEKEKNLELLKRKRAGEDIEEVTDSGSDSGGPRVGIYDSDANSDLKALSEFEDEDEEEQEEVVERRSKPKREAKSKSNPTTGGEDDSDYEDLSDFLVTDDEDDPIGVPTMQIPLEFTHQAHKPLKEHFKDAVEWMVHNKINPAFPRNDPVYRQAFIKLDAEYSGYAKSKFVSTQWTADFTRAIFARPILVERHPLNEGEGLTVEGVYKCDACNHRKHVPTYAVAFQGKPYDKNTLEELDQDSDDSSREEVDENSYVLPAETKEWYAGVTCFSNAQHAHTLIHWKYALNDWVVDNLANTGELTPTKLAARDKMNAKKRANYANDLVDQWAVDGVIRDLYRDFKGQLDAAREAKTGGRWEKRA